MGCSPWGHKESDTAEQLHFTSRLATVQNHKWWLDWGEEIVGSASFVCFGEFLFA